MGFGLWVIAVPPAAHLTRHLQTQLLQRRRAHPPCISKQPPARARDARATAAHIQTQVTLVAIGYDRIHAGKTPFMWTQNPAFSQ